MLCCHVLLSRWLNLRTLSGSELLCRMRASMSLLFMYLRVSLCLVYCYLSQRCLKERTIYDQSCTITSEALSVSIMILYHMSRHTIKPSLTPDRVPYPADNGFGQPILVTPLPHSNIPIGGSPETYTGTSSTGHADSETRTSHSTDWIDTNAGISARCIEGK